MRTNLLLITFLFLVPACKSVDKDDPTLSPNIGVTREQVVAIATKYNLQDSIAEGYESPRFKPFLPEAYPYLTEEFWDRYFWQWRKFSDHYNEDMQFRQDLASIRSMAEYYKVIESYPRQHEFWVKTSGGLEGYNREKSEKLNGNYHIYLCKDGAIAIIPAETDKGTYPGKRLDKGKQ